MNPMGEECNGNLSKNILSGLFYYTPDGQEFTLNNAVIYVNKQQREQLIRKSDTNLFEI